MSSQITWRADAEVCPKADEVGTTEWFSKDVGSVIRGSNAKDFKLVQIHKIARSMVFHAKVSYFRMPTLVLSELSSCVVVTVKRGGTGKWDMETLK